MRKRLYMLSVLLIAIVQAVLAQVTTSALTGKVTLGNTNESVIGATIQVVHVPSGTRYATVTNADGRYTIQGMRVGGPYTIKVSYIGYQPTEISNVTLQLGETYNQNFKMAEDASILGEVVISGKGSKFTAEKTGASTNISNTQIMNMPTINRSITDIARLSPYSNGMSFAGGDGRSSNFTLDGANLNNNFGLSDKLPGGGSPISMDAIDEVQVTIAPYDVRQSNFIGGGALETGELPLARAVEAFESALIAEALRRHGHSLARTAQALQVAKTTLHDKLKKYGLTGES